ncbi:hypothetical protein D3C86_1823100 [compost metagenome]
MFIDTVINNLFDQNINTIVGGRSVTQFTYIHPRSEADMFTPVERPYGIFIILVQLLLFSHVLQFYQTSLSKRKPVSQPANLTTSTPGTILLFYNNPFDVDK